MNPEYLAPDLAAAAAVLSGKSPTKKRGEEDYDGDEEDHNEIEGYSEWM
jgi:hypothetical protein